MYQAFRLGPWLVDPAGRRLTDGTAEITLSPRAMGVLDALIRAGTRTATRDELLDAVWPDVAVTDESLTQAVAELRRAFRSNGSDRDIVVTVPKSGYRLALEPVPCMADTAAAIENAPAITMESYCLVLEAHSALVRADADALAQAVALSREAVASSPGSALAHATHSIMLVHRGLYGGGGGKLFSKALEHAETAVSLGSQSSISHAALGFAIGAPGGGGAFNSLTRAMMLNDRNGEGPYLAARVAFVSGDYRTAATLALKSAELVSDASRPLFLAARAARQFDPDLSMTIARRCVRALERRLVDDPEEPRSRHTLGPALGLAGEIETAWSTIAGQRRDRSMCAIHDMFGFAHIRDDDRAVEALENALDEGFRDERWLMHEPMLAGIRKNRRFMRLAGALKAS